MNLLLITSDQHRADALSCAGHPLVHTPHLDGLAAEGTRFTQALSTCPICIPARTSLITGRHAHRNGCPSYRSSHRIPYHPEDLLGGRITAAGFQTCLIGKSHWHLDPSYPAGFETFHSSSAIRRERARAGFGANQSAGIGPNEMAPAIEGIPERWSDTRRITDLAMDFLEDRDRSRPFFLWASYLDPHPANVVPASYKDYYDPRDVPDPVTGDWVANAPRSYRSHRAGNGHATMPEPVRRKSHAAYFTKITYLDHQLGRLLGSLQRTGEMDNTLIVYTSDHGEHLGDHGDYGKATFLESSTRIPLLIRPPKNGSLPPPQAGSLVEFTDLFATLCDYAAAPLPADCDSISLRPILEGRSSQVRDQTHGHIDNQHMWRDAEWKYLAFTDDGSDMLFHTAEDPQDMQNLIHDEPERAQRMRKELLEHLAAIGHDDLQDGDLIHHNKPLPNDLDRNVLGWMGLPGTT